MNPDTIKMERTRNPNQLIIRTDRQIDGHKEGQTESRVRKDKHTDGQTFGESHGLVVKADGS